MTDVGQLRRIELAPAAAVFRSLGDPTRLAILRRLAEGPARGGELVDEVGLAVAGYRRPGRRPLSDLRRGQPHPRDVVTGPREVPAADQAILPCVCREVT